MISFSESLDGFSLRLKVETVPRVPRARMLNMEECSGVLTLPEPAKGVVYLESFDYLY